MSTKPRDFGRPPASVDDPQWQLVERIVASPSFARTERLSSFLSCVCYLASVGEAEKINEQYVGMAVFGRSPDYDPGIDSIVRSHASRLRQRLQQYFEEEGRDEPLLLSIPKGGYTPVFTPRYPVPQFAVVHEPSRASERTQVEADGQEWPGAGTNATSAESVAVTGLATGPTSGPATDLLASRANRTVLALTMALVSVCILCIAALSYALVERRHARALTTPAGESTRLFWGSLFSAGQKTVVVHGDSGLVLLLGLTHRHVTLDAYLSGEYLRDLPPSPYPPEHEALLGTRRYTSIVDLAIQERIFRLPGVNLANTQFRYARDLRMDDIKRADLILLGTTESTPWVQLFEPQMNFSFDSDHASGIFAVMNRTPLPGEAARYLQTGHDPQVTIYALAAYRPGLSGSGKVLILEGQSMAGTEAAADFVFDDAYFVPFLQSIRRPDGSIPYFEVLLRSRSVSVEASKIEVVARRIENS